jgi:hypothetical protein
VKIPLLAIATILQGEHAMGTGSASPILGAGIHLVLPMAFGMPLALLVRRLQNDAACRGGPRGAGYGLILYVVRVPPQQRPHQVALTEHIFFTKPCNHFRIRTVRVCMQLRPVVGQSHPGQLLPQPVPLGSTETQRTSLRREDALRHDAAHRGMLKPSQQLGQSGLHPRRIVPVHGLTPHTVHPLTDDTEEHILNTFTSSTD